MRRLGGGLAVVGIHGNGVDHRILLALDDVFEEVGGFERIYPDLPGFGATEALDGDGGLPELAEWVVTEIRDLVGDRKFAVLGNSLGGLLARHVRAQLPDQVVGMALLAPVVDPDADKRTVPEFKVVERDMSLLMSLSEEDRETFDEQTSRQTRSTWETYREVALPGIRAADEEAMERLGRRYFLDDVPEDVGGSFDGPTLIVTGRHDHVVGFEDQFALLPRYPGATFAVLDGAGHNVHIDQPVLTRDLLRHWARRLPRG